jgi:NAD(P)-dependent dehydrogenase (short-subunit alcohol dehydrogenase family)
MIVLTGASGGIGHEIINHLCKMDDVVGFYNTTHPGNHKVSKIIYEKVNIEDKSEIDRFVENWKSKLSNITLVHCAAAKNDGLAVNYPLADWDKVVGVNLRANFILTQALLPRMMKDNWGRVIHISSNGAIDGDVGTMAYSASKSGLIGMSRVLGKEYARFNITSNVLMLGAFETGLFLELSDKQKDKIQKKIPSKKLGNSSNIVNAIDFLIKSEYVNGSVINIDGGV